MRCSPGYQAKYLARADGKALIAYLRNFGGLLPQNVRTRTARPLQVTLSAGTGTVAVWDLDERRLLKSVSVKPGSKLDLGETDHDFALVFRAK